MKKIILAAAALILAASSLKAQEPTSTWPYLYPEFTQGVIHQLGGIDKEAILNVHLLHGNLHFIDGDLIKEVRSSEVFSVQIGKDVYVNSNGKMMRVLAKNDNGFVSQDVEIDIVKLNSTGGAYGSSSSSVSTQALSSLEGIGASNSSSNINHMELRANKENGAVLPLIKKNYLVVNGLTIYATKKDVSGKVDAASFNAFLKSNKIQWRDPQSLLQVIDFIASQTN